MSVKDINDWEILTPSGWSNFSGIKKIEKRKHVVITFIDETSLICSENHKLKTSLGTFCYAKNLKKGKCIVGINGDKIIKSKRTLNKKIDLYDILNVDKNSEFYSNDVVSHNCAFIENAGEIWVSAQQTMATGGKAILLSTPNGMGGFFHQAWTNAEEGRNGFNPISLPWHLHPERNQEWRDKQTKELGEKQANQECECSFISSGNTVLLPEIIAYYKDAYICDPIEKRGVGNSFWIWNRPDYSKKYLITADVSRGDSTDFSAFHVIDLENLEQVAEFKDVIDTKSYGSLLVSAAYEYNQAILVVENNNLGWATLQQVIDLNYPNTFYSSADLTYIDVEQQMVGKINRMEKNMIPGFSTTSRTRPLIISKLESYFRDKAFILKSMRTWSELSVFIWNGNRAEAMYGYNDDLVTSLGMGLWVRDTALRLKTETSSIHQSMLNAIKKTEANIPQTSHKSHINPHDPWSFSDGSGRKQDLKWLL